MRPTNNCSRLADDALNHARRASDRRLRRGAIVLPLPELLENRHMLSGVTTDTLGAPILSHRASLMPDPVVAPLSAQSDTSTTPQAVSDDQWDISSAVEIIDHSPVLQRQGGSDIRNMFGGRFGDLVTSDFDERNNTVFDDYQPADTVHFVEWKTQTPIILESLNLFASHDGSRHGILRDATARGFKRFTLLARHDEASDFEVIYEFSPSNPYGGGDEMNELALSVNVNPTMAQQFRAEFVQWGEPSSHSAPRIVELDGFGTSTLVDSKECLELLAKDYVYDNKYVGQVDPCGKTYTAEVFSDLTGFYALGLTSDAFDPILVFRGTEPTQINDVFADFQPQGVGFNQFEANRESVEDWIDEASVGGTRVTLVGHSLGGALAQWFAADYTSLGKPLGEVVTFNSPGICDSIGCDVTASQFRSDLTEGVTHYITSGDLVSMAGDAFLEGTYQLAKFSTNTLNPASFFLDKHLLPVLAESTHGGQRVRPSDVELTRHGSVDWLNNDFFTYLDVGYFTWLAAAWIAADGLNSANPLRRLPPALLFRSTTEDLRETIGTRLHELANLVDLDISPTEVTAKFPRVETNLGPLEIYAEDMSVRYQVTPDESWRVQGLVSVAQLESMKSESGRAVMADFAGENYIEMKPGGFEVVGKVSVENIPIGGGWELRELLIEVDTEANHYSGAGKLLIPAGIEIDAALDVENGEINSFAIGLDDVNLHIPGTGVPGAFLQRIAGAVDHIAKTDPNPVEFRGELGLTFGPEINVSLPDLFGAESYTGALGTFDVSGAIDTSHLQAIGDIQIVNGVGAAAQADIELNWRQGTLDAAGEFRLLSDFVVMNSAFRADSKGDVTMAGDATVALPDGVPLVGGKTIASGQGRFQYRNDEDRTNDFISGVGVVDLGPFGDYTAGVKVDFTGDFDFITSEEELEAHSPTFDVLEGTGRLLIAADWENDIGPVTVFLQAPDGTVFTESDMAANTRLSVLEELSGPTSRTVGVLDPMPGLWSIILSTTEGLGQIEYLGFKNTESPVIEITSPASDTFISQVPIEYDAFDGDSDARISLFYDTDQDGIDGRLIVDDLAELDGAGSYAWDTSDLPPGRYYVYGMIDDGNNVVVFDYAEGAVVVGLSVQHVRAGSSNWNLSFLSAVDPEMQLGRIIPTGSSDQLAPLPWVNLDQISVTFNKNVQVSAADLTVSGINTTTYQLDDSAFSYDSATHTATWTLASPLDTDRLLLSLSDEITDQYGTVLDGEWTDGISTESGDGIPGGPFNFQLNILPGDVNQSQLVAADDALTVIGKVISLPGFPQYSPLSDVNGNGLIAADDALLTIDRVISFLPQGEPVAATALPVRQRPSELLVPSSTDTPDVDADGEVNFTHFVVLANGFGSTDATRSEGDVNGDRNVDFEDFQLLTNNFGTARRSWPRAIDLVLHDGLTNRRDQGDDDLDVALPDDLDQTIEDLLLARA